MAKYVFVLDRISEVLEKKYLFGARNNEANRIYHIARVVSAGCVRESDTFGFDIQGERHDNIIYYDSVSADGERWFHRERMPLSDTFSLRYATRREIGLFKRLEGRREREHKKKSRRIAKAFPALKKYVMPRRTKNA